MARASLTCQQFQQSLKPGQVLFKPKHIKSKGQFIVKYKKLKKYKKSPKTAKIDYPKLPLLKFARENTNQCLQNNGKLLFAWGSSIVNLNLKSMKTQQKSSKLDLVYPGGVVMCAIPDQNFFCVDCSKGLIFIIDVKLNILVKKNIEPRPWGTIIYLNGLIYGFKYVENYYRSIEAYDLKAHRRKKAVKIKMSRIYCGSSCVVFEEKIAITASKGDVGIFDPFCNSHSKVLKLGTVASITLLVANDKLYCIRSRGDVYESAPRDFTQWICIGLNRIFWNIHGLPSYSLYNGSIYFVGAPQNPSLYKFNLKSRRIEFVDHLF